jgi:hypothetical protein
MGKNNKLNLKPCIPEVEHNQTVCPVCGGMLDIVDYYSAYVVSTQSARLDYATVKTKTTYKNVVSHTGGLCRRCAAEKFKNKRIRAGITAAVGFICGVALTLFLALRAASGGPGGGPEIILMIAAFGFGAWGVSVLGDTNMQPGRKLSEFSLYFKFISLLKKEKFRTGAVFLTPSQVKQLEYKKR